MADWLTDERITIITAENHALQTEVVKLRRANHYLAMDLAQAHHDMERLTTRRKHWWRRA